MGGPPPRRLNTTPVEQRSPFWTTAWGRHLQNHTAGWIRRQNPWNRWKGAALVAFLGGQLTWRVTFNH